MKLQGYTVVIEQGKRGFVATFPQLCGLRAYGATREDAEVMADECLSEYLSESRDHLDSLSASGATASVQSVVLDAVVAALGGNAAGAWRCRFTPFAAADLPADNVIPEDEDPTYSDNSGMDLQHHFKVRYTAAAVDTADKVADARYVRGQKLLLADPTLGGLVKMIRYAGRKWEFEKGEQDTVAIVVTYQVIFTTSYRDPSVAAV